MIRKIIEINEDKCNGCGLCAEACHEGAIGMINGKAKLLRDDYCDGLGDCLPICPVDAIRFIEREANAYDDEAVKENQRQVKLKKTNNRASSDCAGTILTSLKQWPVQIKLMPIKAPYYEGADILIAADCAAYAYASFHNDFMKDKVTIIGCPKLDDVDYSEKLTEIIRQNSIKSVSIVRMEVPCCGGIEHAGKKAIQDSGKFLPWQIYTISTDGKILK